MPWTRYRPTKRAVFWFLMVASALALLLPRAWSDSLKHAGQFLVPAMDWQYSVAHRTAVSLAGLEPSSQEPGLPRQALENQLASEMGANRQLREENARLRALRENDVHWTFPLLPAKVVARDIVAWRDSLLAERGSSRAVRRKDWVASRFFVDRGQASRVEAGQVVLARECLLGRVELVSPYMARVQLLSDIDSPRTEVRIGVRSDDGFEFVDYPCSLRGIGHGRMKIEDVPYRYVQTDAVDGLDGPAQRIRVGDLVVAAPGQLGLPMPLVIGRITELLDDPQKRLVVSLIVEPVIPIEQLRDVIIIPLVPIERLPLRE